MAQVLSGPGTYKKGGWTLHMLRGIVGDAAFWTGIRDYYLRHRDGNATTADFRRAMEQASGRELSWFFDQWLTRGGFPKLRARWSYDAAEEAPARRGAAPVRRTLPPADRVALEVEGEPGPRIEWIEVKEQRETVTLALDKPPTSVVFDPRTYVLMDADVVRKD
jgi:aminopeptidase N